MFVWTTRTCWLLSAPAYRKFPTVLCVVLWILMEWSFSQLSHDVIGIFELLTGAYVECILSCECVCSLLALWTEISVIILYLFVLMGCSLLPNALRTFQIYCAPPNLGIRTWICRLNFAQRPIFSGLRFFNDPEIWDSGPPAQSPSRRTWFQLIK